VIVHGHGNQKVDVHVHTARQQPGSGMSTGEKKAYPLRISPQVLEAMQRWANDDLRSLNAQIEYVLRDALRKAARIKAEPARPAKD
jgi:hypothetical protein